MSLFSWNRSSTQSSGSTDSERTLVDSAGRTSPTPTQSSARKKLLKLPSYEAVALPDGAVVRLPQEPYEANAAARVDFETVMQVARETIRLLRGLGVHSCAAGDLAARVYGATRDPEMIDLVILTDPSEYATLLRRLISHNSKYFILPSSPSSLTPPTLNSATALSQQLLYRLPSTALAVHLHLPPTPTVPYLTSADITWHSSFPLLPLPLVLLAKLRKWMENRYVLPGKEISMRDRRRQWSEHADLEMLMARAVKVGLDLRKEKICEGLLHSRERRDGVHQPLNEGAEQWVKEYLSVYPESKRLWVALGFRLQDPSRQGPMLSRTQTHSSTSTSTSSSSFSILSTPQASSPAQQPQARPRFSDQQSFGRPSFSSSRAPTPLQQPRQWDGYYSSAEEHARPRSTTPSLSSRSSRFPLSVTPVPPVPQLPPSPVSAPSQGRPGSALGTLRSKSPFRRKSMARLREKEGKRKGESYFEWDD